MSTLTKIAKKASSAVEPVLPELTSFQYKREDGTYFLFCGISYKNDKPYKREWKKTDKMTEFVRPIQPSFPSMDAPDKYQKVEINLDGICYQLIEEKYGNKSVCHLVKDGKEYMAYVSKKVIISIIADETSKSWNWVDQHIKGLLGLKTSGTSKKSQVAEII